MQLNIHTLKSYFSNVIAAGFHGELLPPVSGLTSVIKGHGHYTSKIIHDEELSTPGITEHQMSLTKEKAILLIRNPYDTIYGYRHYVFHGQHGHTYISKFLGKGKLLRDQKRWEKIIYKYLR